MRIGRKWILGTSVAGVLLTAMVCFTYWRHSVPATRRSSPGTFFKSRDLPILNSHEVGLLVSGHEQAMAKQRDGVSYGGPQKVYVFTSGGEFYRPFLLPASRFSSNTLDTWAPVGKDGKLEAYFGATRIPTTEEMRVRGIETPFALVDVEVNRGLGTPATTAAFVATRIETLHTTSQYPLDPVAVMRDARRRFETWKLEQTKVVNSRFQEVATATTDALGGKLQSSEIIFISWLPATECVQIRFEVQCRRDAYPAHPREEVYNWPAEPGIQLQSRSSLILQYSKDGTFLNEGTIPLNIDQTVLPGPPNGKVWPNSGETEITARRLESMPGRAVGILLMDARANLLQKGGWSEDPLAAFAHGSDDYRIVFVPHKLVNSAKYEPVKRRISVPVGQARYDQFEDFSDVVPLTEESATELGIASPFALVALQVNGGKGAPSLTSNSFVATQIETLSNTGQYPLNPVSVMNDATERYVKLKISQTDELKRRMRELEESVLDGPAATGPREFKEITDIRWSSADEVLLIDFYMVITDGAYSYEHDPPHPHAGLGGITRTGKQFGTARNLLLKYSKEGKFMSSESSSWNDFSRDLPKRRP